MKSLQILGLDLIRPVAHATRLKPLRNGLFPRRQPVHYPPLH